MPRTTGIWFALLLTAAAASAQSTRIVHTPPTSLPPHSETSLAFTLLGKETAVKADLWIRATGEVEYVPVAAVERAGTFRVDVPLRYLAPPGFEYYIVVRTEGGTEISTPPENPSEAPHSVRVGSGAETDRLLLLTPEPGATLVPGEELLVTILFDPPLLPPSTVLFYWDGKEIDEGLEITEDYLLYERTEEPARGAHTIAAVLLDESGETFEREWIFYYQKAVKGAARLPLSGKLEAGYAAVRNGPVDGEPYLPYDPVSTLRFDMYGFGEWRGRSLYFTVSRDPIYDVEIRATGRISGDRMTLEIGDVYPSFSELTVSWLSGEGGVLSLQGERLKNTVFLVRTIPSDTTGGFGTYSQFLGGERISYARERWEAGFSAAYGWEREKSVPDSLRFLLPVNNLVLSGNGSVRIAGETRFDLESGWSDTEGDDTTTAVAYRAVLTLLDSPDRSLSLEYHDYEPGYYALGSPTVDGGERGFLVDGALRIASVLRQSARAEFYQDDKTIQELKEGKRIVQLYGRTDVDWEGKGFRWNTYFLFRSYEIPYLSDPYTSRYGTIGLYATRGPHSLSLSGTRSTSRSSSRTDSWSASGYLSGSTAGGFLSWKLGERYSASETEEDTTGTGAEVLISDQERWTTSAEASVLAGGLEWRTEYERIDEKDPAEEESYVQHLFSFVIGRRF